MIHDIKNNHADLVRFEFLNFKPLHRYWLRFEMSSEEFIYSFICIYIYIHVAGRSIAAV